MTTNRLYALRAVPGLYASKPGIQVAVQTSHKASDEDLQFFPTTRRRVGHARH